MTMPPNIKDREYQKFTEIGSGDTAIRTVGESSFAGLKFGWLITTVEISDTATKVIPNGLTNINSVQIINLSPSDSFYIGPANTVTADAVVGITSGVEIGIGGNFAADLSTAEDAVELWVIAKAGKTIKIQIVEFA